MKNATGHVHQRVSLWLQERAEAKAPAKPRQIRIEDLSEVWREAAASRPGLARLPGAHPAAARSRQRGPRSTDSDPVSAPCAGATWGRPHIDQAQQWRCTRGA